MSERRGALDRIAELAPEWDELADRTRAAPFVRPGWVAAWWRAFGAGTLDILTLRWEGELVAVVPTVRHGRKLGGPTNWHTPAFGPVARDHDAARELAYSMFASGARRIDLAFVDQDDPGAVAFQWAAAHAGFRLASRTLLRSPYVAIEGQWAEYERSLGRKRRGEIRRRRRLLESRGPVRLDVETGEDGADLPLLLEEGFRVEAAAWKGRRATAIMSRPETRAFYSEIAAWAADRGWLRLAFLRTGERCVAFDLCLEQGGVHYLLKTGYDPAVRSLGPGVLIRYDMLARAFALGLQRYEFLGADDPWKLEWTRTVHERKILRALGPLWMGPLDWYTAAPVRTARRARRALRATLRR